MKTIISTDRAPAAIGPYSQAVEAGGLLFLSGQIPLDPVTGTIPGGIEAQARQAFSNVHALLDEAGYAMSDVVKVTVYLADIADFQVLNAVYAEQFSGDFPARSAVGGLSLPKGVLVELDVIACK